MKTLLTISGLLAVLALSGCNSKNLGSVTFDKSSSSEKPILGGNGSAILDLPRVVDQGGFPVSGAEVMIGSAPDRPFPGNIAITDASGYISIPVSWKSSLPITVSANGFVRTTVLDVAPGGIDLRIEREDGPNKLEVKGKATNFGRLKRDGKLDFALVVPSLNRRQLLGFDLSHVISPEIDTISVVGRKIQLPSNITLPKQKETYIFPITFNKPQYRMFVRRPGEFKFVATHGQFPLRQVIDDMKAGKSFFDVLEHFSFVGSGQMDLMIPGPISGQDIAVDQVRFSTTKKVTAPNYAAENVMLSLAMVEDDGNLSPTDIKKLLPGTSRDLVLPNDSRAKKLLSVLLEKDDPAQTSSAPSYLANRSVIFDNTEDDDSILDDIVDPNGGGTSKQNILIGVPDMNFEKLSLTIETFNGNQTPEFLPFVKAPTLNNGSLTLSPPALKGSIRPLGAYILLSKVEEIVNGKVRSERKTKIWEIFSGDWISQVNLPQANWQADPNSTYRWEVIYLGTNLSTFSPTDGIFNLDAVTHITRNALNF